MSAGPILLTEIQGYIELFGLPVDKMEFITVIKTMDRAYLDKANA